MDKERRTSIKIPPDLLDKIRQDAERQNRSVHNMILTILKEHYAKNS